MGDSSWSMAGHYPGHPHGIFECQRGPIRRKDLLLVRRPFLFIEKKFLRKDVLYKPEKAIYGFKGSPRLWGLTRDETLGGLNIQGGHEGKLMNFVLELLQSEPNLWKLQNADEDLIVYALLMTYLDDLLITAPEPLMVAMQKKIQDTWSTSTPRRVGQEPVRFLGLEITKAVNPKTGREDWVLTQQSYTQDLVQKEEIKPKKITLSKDQSLMEPKEETPQLERIRLAAPKDGWRSSLADHTSQTRHHVCGVKNGISCHESP